MLYFAGGRSECQSGRGGHGPLHSGAGGPYYGRGTHNALEQRKSCTRSKTRLWSRWSSRSQCFSNNLRSPLSLSLSWRTSATRPQLKTTLPHLNARSGLTTQRSWSLGTKAPRNWRTVKSTTSAVWANATVYTSTTARAQTRATTVLFVGHTSPMPS